MRVNTDGFELDWNTRSLFLAVGPLTMHVARWPRTPEPLHWWWSKHDSQPDCGWWRPTRTHTLNARLRTLELVLDWTRPVPGSAWINLDEPADGDLARVEREEREGPLG
jgi:hypothetical protein